MKRSAVIWEIVAWTVFFPAAFVLVLEGPEQWLVIAAMIVGGLLLIDRSLWVLRRRVRATA